LIKSEIIRRGFQYLVCGRFFDAPLLLNLRLAVYRKFFNIGKEVVISREVLFIRPHDIKTGYLKIGNRVSFNHNTEIDYSGGVEIHDDVWISQFVIIETHLHSVKTDNLKKLQPTIKSPLIIGKDAWIGAFATILSSVNYIGKGAVIGAGAVVNRDVEDWAVVGGVPAKKISERIHE